MTDRFEVPEVSDLPVLIRAEVERYIRAGRGVMTEADRWYLDARYGPAPAAEAQEPAPGPVFTREAAAVVETLAAARVAWTLNLPDRLKRQDEYETACRAYLRSLGRDG